MFIYPVILAAAPQIVATLTVKTQTNEVAVRKRITIVDRLNQELLWHGLVEVDGEVTRILPLKYATSDYMCVTAYDDAAVYNAVVADYVQTEIVEP